MDKLVKEEYDKQKNQIIRELDFLADDEISDELIKTGFDGIRILIDYCEKLAMEGVSAIETIE
jgi:aryl carrier-like protein